MARRDGFSAAWVRARGDLRRRAVSWLALAVLLGLAGAFVVVTTAGSRRTASAYDRFLDGTNAFDLVTIAVCAGDIDPAEPECLRHQADAAAAMRALPEVADVVVARNTLVPILKEDGSSIQPEEAEDGCFTGSGEVDIIGSPDNRFGTAMNRRRFSAGRAADRTRRDEVVLSEATARREGIAVGDRLRIFAVDACEGIPREEWPEPHEVTVVGVHLAPGEIQPEHGFFLQSVGITPPLLAALLEHVGRASPPAMAMRLSDGTTPEQLTVAAARAGYPVEIVLPHYELAEQVRDGLRPDSFGLAVLAALGAATAFVVLSQAIARQLWAGARDHEQLHALGFTRRDRTRVGVLQSSVLGVAAAGVTIVGAVAASPTMPIGRARSIEPDRGIDIDLTVIGLGALGVVALTTGVGYVVSRWIALRTAPGSARPRVSRLASALAGAGAPPTAVCGARMAFERARGARAVPLVSGLAGAIVGIGALLGSLTFSSSLDHLLATPRLVGWNWDGMLSVPDDRLDERSGLGAVERLVADVRAIDGVARAGYGTLFPAFDDPVLRGTEPGDDVDAQGPWLVTFSSGPGAVAPTVLEGRAPTAPDELLLTRLLADETGLDLGDTVDVYGRSFVDGGDEAGVATSQEVTLVGIGVLPVGDGRFERSLSLTYDGLQRLAAHARPHVIYLDLADGADVETVARELTALGVPPEAPYKSEIDVVELVDLDVRRADNVPTALGALMAILAAGVLIHLVVTSVRTRQVELATLQTLGMAPRQAARVVAWQTAFVMAVTAVAAAIIGVVAGREVWLSYARRLGVAPEVSVPGAVLGVVLAASVVLAIVIASLAWWTHHRRHSVAATLRSE